MMNLKPDDPRSQKKGEKGHRSRASPKQKSKQFSFSIPADSIPGKVIADVRAFVQEKINSLQSLDKKNCFSQIFLISYAVISQIRLHGSTGSVREQPGGIS